MNQEEDNDARWLAVHYHDTPVQLFTPLTIADLRSVFAQEGWPVVSDRYLEAFRRELIRERMLQPNTRYGIPAGKVFTRVLSEGVL